MDNGIQAKVDDLEWKQTIFESLDVVVATIHWERQADGLRYQDHLSRIT